jgi:hypothetical protein
MLLPVVRSNQTADNELTVSARHPVAVRRCPGLEVECRHLLPLVAASPDLDRALTDEAVGDIVVQHERCLRGEERRYACRVDERPEQVPHRLPPFRLLLDPASDRVSRQHDLHVNA